VVADDAVLHETAIEEALDDLTDSAVEAAPARKRARVSLVRAAGQAERSVAPQERLDLLEQGRELPLQDVPDNASNKYFFDSSRIQQGPGSFDTLEEAGAADGRDHDQVDSPAEEILQSLQQAEVRIRVFPGTEVLELDQEIHVTPRRIEPFPYRRPEQFQATNAKAPAETLDRLVILAPLGSTGLPS
jgi:hypothetical protein